MIGLLVELISAFAWIGFMFIGVLALVGLRLLVWVLTPILRGSARSFRRVSPKPHVFRGEGNDLP